MIWVWAIVFCVFYKKREQIKGCAFVFLNALKIKKISRVLILDQVTLNRPPILLALSTFPWSNIHSLHVFTSNSFFRHRLKCYFSEIQIFWKITLPYPDKKVFEMLFGMSTIILNWSHSPNLIIIRYLCFKIGQYQPCIACEVLLIKEKACILLILDLDKEN